MSIIRSEKNDNYTTICNKCLRDTSLSARAKGIFAYIMTLPDDWKLYKSELHKHFTEGREAINTAFAELETAGYIKKQAGRLENGSLNGWDYTIYESTESPETRKTVNPLDGKPASTNNLSLQNTDKTKASTPKPEVQLLAKSFTPPTLEEALKWAIESGHPESLVSKAWEYYNRLNWKDVRGSQVRAWKQKILAVWLTPEKLAEVREVSKPQNRTPSF